MDKEEAAVGERMQTLRKAKGLSTTELADLIGMSQAQVSRLETGRQGFRSATLFKIAKALDVEPYYLYMGEGPEMPAYGIMKSPRLRRALQSAEFTDLAEKLAEFFLSRKQVFKSVKGLVAHL